MLVYVPRIRIYAFNKRCFFLIIQTLQFYFIIWMETSTVHHLNGGHGEVIVISEMSDKST